MCSKRLSSIYLRVAVGRRIRLSPTATCSFVTCGPRDRRHVRFSPTAYGPCTGHSSVHEQGCQGLSFVVDKVGKSFRHPNTVMSNTPLPLSHFFHEWGVYQGYRLGFSAQFGPATHFSGVPPLQRGSPDSSKQRLKGFCATAGTVLPPQRGNRVSPSIGP